MLMIDPLERFYKVEQNLHILEVVGEGGFGS